MTDQVITIIWNALGILIPAFVIMLIEVLRRKLGLEKLRKIQEELYTKQELAALAVRFVEQAYKDLHGPDKYNQAAQWLVDRAMERGLKINADEVKGLIEAALRMIKDQLGEEWANTVGRS